MTENLQELFEFLRQGGWPMLPLAVCSVAALAVTMERTWALRRSVVIPSKVLDLTDAYVDETSAEPTLRACERVRGAFPRVISDILKSRHLGHAHVIETMNATGRRETEGLDRGIILLEIVAGIAPLIGLLGTVLGMVNVFDAINTHGIGNAQQLSAGISKALVTTIAGLCVGIPSLAFHGYLSKRIESLSAEMHDLAVGFIAKLHVAVGNDTGTEPAWQNRPSDVARPRGG